MFGEVFGAFEAPRASSRASWPGEPQNYKKAAQLWFFWFFLVFLTFIDKNVKNTGNRGNSI